MTELDKSKEETNSEQAEEQKILEAIPEEQRREFVGIIQQHMISSITHRNNPIAEKLTPEHITQIITKSDERDQRDRKERSGQRYYNLMLILIGLLFVGFLVIFLQNNKDLLVTIITAILSFVGGFGLGKSIKSKEE